MSEEWLLWRFSITFLLSFAFVSRLEAFSCYVVVVLVSVFAKFAQYKGFDISAEFILFATHNITFVKSPSSTVSSVQLSEMWTTCKRS